MSRPKLLLADDSVTIRKVVELTFADEGIDVTAVGDAESAMQRFVDIQPDIVLVDVGLEGTSGYQICEMIKADDATRHIPVLLLVGSFEPFDQSAAERARADGFLTKPFHSIRDLVARVKDLLSPQAAAAAAGGAEQATIDQFTADAFAEKVDGSGSPGPETEDIEDLYRSSFANTVEIDEYDTVDDVLGDTALDDEMIEATFPAEAFPHNISEHIPPADVPETVEMSKEFDWSPESVVLESRAPQPQPQQTTFEPRFVFEETPVEDEDVSPASEAVLERITDEPTSMAEAVSGQTEEAEPQSTEGESSDTLTELTHGTSNADGSADSEGPTAIEQPAETLEEQAEPEVWPDVEEEQPGGEIMMSQLSPEMINLIAEKVVERLSDRVIREVALETVPQIAEKLIREALDTSSRKD